MLILLIILTHGGDARLVLSPKFVATLENTFALPKE